MRRISYSLSLLVFAVAGCGTSTPIKDLGTADMAMGGDMVIVGGDDMTQQTTLTGMKIFAGPSIQLAGVTSDDYVVYLDKLNGAQAVSLAGGGTPAKLTMTNSTYSDITVINNVVFAMSNTDMTSRLGDLVVWTSSGAAVKLNNVGASRLGVTAASDDGKFIMYSDKATATSGDIYLAKVDGSGAKVIFASTSLDPMGCFAQLGFAGGKFLVAHCDLGQTNATISAVNPADGVTTVIKTGARVFFSPDPTGSKVVVVEAAVVPPMIDGGVPDAGVMATPSKAWVINTDGTNPVLLDTDVFYGLFTPKGDAVLYGTNAPALRRATLPNPVPTTLTTMNFGGFATLNGVNVAFSPDSKYVITIKSATMGGTEDLYLASTDTPGTPATLVAQPTGCLFSDAFTSDSSHVLFYSSCVSAMGLVVGTFKAASVGGGMPVTLGTKVWNDYVAAKPTTVIYNDNWKARINTNGRADLKVADVSQMVPTPMVIATGAEADFFTNKAKDKIVFAYAVDPTIAGIYVAPVP